MRKRTVGSNPTLSAIYGNMAQLVEQLTVNQWVTGSSPVIPAICWCGSTVEQLTCNQQVVGSIPITSSNVEDFPSGQRGQTVNLLALLSVVRIHHPPPTIYKVKCGCGGIGRRTRLRIWRLRRGGSTPFIRTTLLIDAAIVQW